MNVLSLFDGISCGKVALERSGFKISNYFAAEIDKEAIALSKKHHPEIIQLGDIRDINYSELPKIDLLLAGFECQSYSVGGKMDASGFWQVELLKTVLEKLNPEFYLFENVKSKGDIITKIDKKIGIENRLICSSLLSAQKRPRRYWTNIEILEIKPKDETLYSICDNQDDLPICFSSSGRGQDGVERRISSNLKAHTLTKQGYSNRSFSGYITKKRVIRDFSISEIERLQTLPEGYLSGLKYGKARGMAGNGWTVDVIAHILRGMK